MLAITKETLLDSWIMIVIYKLTTIWYQNAGHQKETLLGAPAPNTMQEKGSFYPGVWLMKYVD